MSAYIYEIVSHTDKVEAAKDWLDNAFRLFAEASQADIDIDLYLPVDCKIGEEPPNFIIRLGFESHEEASAFLSDPSVRSLLAKAGWDGILAGEFMRVERFAVDGVVPTTFKGGFSFVVRYQLPADDVAEFQNYYMRMHPPILAEFEGIRNILCYIPEQLKGTPLLPKCNYLIGNEVCFDDVASFENALDSPVAEKSKADARTFPPYSGQNPHYPMDRQRLRARTR